MARWSILQIKVGIRECWKGSLAGAVEGRWLHMDDKGLKESHHSLGSSCSDDRAKW